MKTWFDWALAVVIGGAIGYPFSLMFGDRVGTYCMLGGMVLYVAAASFYADRQEKKQAEWEDQKGQIEAHNINAAHARTMEVREAELELERLRRGVTDGDAAPAGAEAHVCERRMS